MKKNASSSGSTFILQGPTSRRREEVVQAPTGSNAISLVLLDTRCASNAATTRRSPSFFSVVLGARKGVVAAKIRSVAVRVRALEAAAATTAGAASASSSSAFQQHLLLAAALSCSSACTQQRLPTAEVACAAALACSSACLQQRLLT